ncbi:hypothetical protein F5B18DRAFT_646110 [Nemania serpens]|nr:hypothetical protein F5B18DRAFT_646110 [Nemania serpens]
MASSNANVLSSTIQAFGLAREPTVWEPQDTAFIDPYIILADLDNSSRPAAPSTPEWRSFKITLPCSAVPAGTYAPSSAPSGPVLLNGYAVSPSHHAYVTFFVQLMAPDGTRLTGMRYRDMIADNYVTAASASTSTSTSTSSTLSKLRWLGVANILNPSSRSNFVQIFRITGKDILARGSVEICPAVDLRSDDNGNDKTGARHHLLSDLILHDPFASGVFALLRQRARDMGGAFVRRFIFISEGYEGHEHSREPSPLELRFNLVVELARPVDGKGGDVNIDVADADAITKTHVSKEPLVNL